MKVILDEKDIESLITKTYQGVSSVKMPEKFEIIVNIESDALRKQDETPTVKTGKMVTPSAELTSVKKELSIDEQNELAKKKGLMANGGRDRVMARF